MFCLIFLLDSGLWNTWQEDKIISRKDGALWGNSGRECRAQLRVFLSGEGRKWGDVLTISQGSLTEPTGGGVSVSAFPASPSLRQRNTGAGSWTWGWGTLRGQSLLQGHCCICYPGAPNTFVSLLNHVARFGWQHHCARKMACVWLQQTLMIRFHYFPVFLEDKG